MDVARRESGTALIMALATLLILTLLGTTSMDNAIMEQRMASSHVNHERAFQNAELGLRSMEQRLLDFSSFSTLETTLANDGIYHSSRGADYLNISSWSGVPIYFNGEVRTGNKTAAVDQAGLGITKVIVEHIKAVGGTSSAGGSSSAAIHYFRVTSLGTDAAYTVANAGAGDRPGTLAMVQSIVAVRMPASSSDGQEVTGRQSWRQILVD